MHTQRWLIGATLATAVAFTAATEAEKRSAAPRDAAVCDVVRAPDSWNHARVRLTGTVTHAFENFTLTDPRCGDAPTSIWLTFGGRVSSGTTYCCPGEGDGARRRAPLVVEGVTLPLVEDAAFEQFRSRLQQRERATMRATLVGTFFAGERKPNSLPGYGHLACCSLFVIERVERFDDLESR